LTSLRQEGFLTAEQMASLIHDFPDLADKLTLDGIAAKTSEQLSAWIKVIQDAMATMTPEA